MYHSCRCGKGFVNAFSCSVSWREWAGLHVATLSPVPHESQDFPQQHVLRMRCFRCRIISAMDGTPYIINHCQRSRGKLAHCYTGELFPPWSLKVSFHPPSTNSSIMSKLFHFCCQKDDRVLWLSLMWKLSSSPAFLMLHKQRQVQQDEEERKLKQLQQQQHKEDAPELPNLYLRHLITVPLRECMANRSTIFISLFLLYLH